MKQPSKKTPSEKEKTKGDIKKQGHDKELREDENNSIYQEENNKGDYPYKKIQDKQFNNQPEFVDPREGANEKVQDR